MRLLLVLVGLGSALPLALALTTVVGLGVLHDLSAVQCALTGTLLLGVGVAGAWTLMGRSDAALVAGCWGWPIGVLLALPGYFPEDVSEGAHAGVRVVLGPFDPALARTAAEAVERIFPVLERAQGRAPLPEAASLAATAPCPTVPQVPLGDDQVALPYEGNGRTLSVPIHINDVELPMLFDTGATLTTLSSDALRRVGISIPSDAPEVTLRTANGERTAKLVFVPELWLGGFPIRGVTVGVCEECADGKVNGLLGLNVSGQFTVTLDTAHHELILTARADPDRMIDIQPWLDVRATTTMYPDGRIEALAEVQSRAPLGVSLAEVGLSCGEHRLQVPVTNVPPGGKASAERMLGRDLDCDAWRVTLERARW